MPDIIRKIDLGDGDTPRKTDLNRSKQDLITELEHLRKTNQQLANLSNSQRKTLEGLNQRFAKMQAKIGFDPNSDSTYQTTVRFTAPAQLTSFVGADALGEVMQPTLADILTSEVGFAYDQYSHTLTIAVTVPVSAFPNWEIKELGQLVNAAIHVRSPDWLVKLVRKKK